jgi:peptidoglycan/xylan/chitin deacetylase (PgdA/CDA1 family)
MHPPTIDQTTRRGLLASALAASLATSARARAAPDRASIAITLDLEMSRHYPTWDQMHWDFEKGNLDRATKDYAVEAARRVKAKGGSIHFFAVGQTMEQEDVGWLKEIVAQGHPVGNHTYDHVNVKAVRAEDIQFRFRRAPWLIEGKTPAEIIAANVRMGASALKERIGIVPAGFRTPGGFSDGLSDRPDLQSMFQKMGYTWVSSKYPAHPLGTVGQAPDSATMGAIVAVQAQAQPFVYPSGLVEVPMSPVSDVTALRSGRWPLESFLEAIRACVTWAIERRAVFCLLAHPSCLVVTDPRFRTIEMIGDMVCAEGDRAAIVDLSTIARETREREQR